MTGGVTVDALKRLTPTMLRSDPPPGTRVRFIRQVWKAKAHDTAVLVGSLRKYVEDRPFDKFRLTFLGEEMIVDRKDITEAD